MSSEMRECPFCGNQPRSGWQGTGVPGMDDCGYWGIDCCNAFAHADTEAEALAQWNRRALLARTEAGADGAVYQMMATDEDVDEDGNVRPDDPRLWMDHTREEYERLKDHPSVRSRIVYTHPQDASGDAAKLSEIERKAVTDLMESQVYEAGGVDDEPPSIDEDEDAYWAYHNYHGLRKLLAMQAKEAK